MVERREPDRELDELTHDVIGAAIEVHRTLGPGLLESLYENALAVELTQRRIPFERQVPISLRYKGVEIGDARLDLLVNKRLVVELKSVRAIDDSHIGQALGYLRAGGYGLALLINFNVARLRDGVKRLVHTQ
jgi:GxxExxY protein